MFTRPFPGQFALRFPFFAPDDGTGGADTQTAKDDPFAEQPGDREPEPDAAAGAGEGEGEGDAGTGEGDGEGQEGEGDEGAGAEGEGEGSGEGEGDGDGEGGEEGDGAQAAAPRKTNWRDRQIIKLRKQAVDAAKERDEARAALEARTKAGETGDGLVSKEEAKKEALEEFRREAYVKDLNAACDRMDEAGVKQYPKTWASRVKEAAEIFGDEMQAKPAFLEAVTALPNAAAVYYELSGDPDRFEALLNMAPHRMGIELGQISARLATPATRRTSKAPDPIKPIRKPLTPERPLEDLANDPSPSAQAEFNRRMAAEERKRAEAQA